MAPKQKWAPKPAVEKLPLAIRKELRDDWDSVKGDYEKKISEILGKEYVINFNPNEVYAYGERGWAKDAPGKMFIGYVEGLISAIEKFVDEYGDDGKLHFNDAVSKSEFTLNVNERGPDAPVICCEVKDGSYRILFKDDCLGYNQTSIYETMLWAIDSVPREGFPVEIKNSIATYWDEEAEDVRAAIGEIIAMPDVQIDPNWEENYEALKTGKPPSRDWKKYFGKVALEYFREGIKGQLEKQGFNGDEMLQEGLAEYLTEKTFKLRIVKKMKKSGVNETFIEDGICYIQTIDENWSYNVYNAGDGIVNLL